MSYCLNPYCPGPQNPDTAKFCSRCGLRLLLGDRYRALKPIARGGFGRTLLAVDEHKPSQPHCVIKQFFPQNYTVYDPERAQELFRREAVQLETLGKHPQIPELLAHFEQEEYHYLVQEFIDGPNLLQETTQIGVLSEVKLWHLLNDLLPVITFIHRHQVIHRDIKPQNLIRRSATQQVVIVDFGAAKSINSSDWYQTGTSIGSPVFAAPEQVFGKATFASDLYSLGVTCVYLLTQVHPAELFDTEEGVWLWRQQLPRPVSLALSNILDKLLQVPLKYRYQSAADVLHDLNAQTVREALGLSEGDRPSIPTARSQPVEAAIKKNPSSNDSNPQPTMTETAMPASHFQFDPAAVSRWVCTHTLTDHSSWVRSVVVNPDGRTLASGSGDRTIKLWDLTTGSLLQTLSAQSGWVRALAVSPDGQMLASCHNDRHVMLWQWETGERLQTLNGHSDWVRAVCFSPNGQHLVSSSQDKTIRLWHLSTGKQVNILVGHAHWVTAVAFSPDSKIIASGSRDKTVRLWHVSTGESIYILSGHQNAVNAIVISPDGGTLASASDDTTIRLWDMQTGKLKRVLSGHDGAVTTLALSADGGTLISGSQDKTIKLWHLQTGTLLNTLTGHTSWVWSVAISPQALLSNQAISNAHIVSGSWDATIKIWQQR